ncbi:hypothetical protein CDEN61S_02395 [Castellaniella denitrificans]|jgi:hypothetical protein|uniref:hypothetical protein n=1 Tax=Castellaniella sp. TaxID=1955812 RepID=UPI002B001BD1|nr:hypothetical protein [Castellaniella sp.]
MKLPVSGFWPSLFCALALGAAGFAAQAADDASGGPDIEAGTRHKVDFADRLARARVGPDDEVVVLVHSAGDCVFCQRWKGSLGGQGEIAHYADTHPGVRYYVVERPRIADAETGDLYPRSLAWLYDKRSGKGKTNLAVPSYDVIVRHKVVWHAYGYSAWGKTVFPAVRSLDGRRSVPGGD